MPTVRTRVRPSPGRGLGLFAVDPIPRFTKILEDDALLSMALGEDLPQLWEKYLALPVDEKRIFDSLSCKFDPDKEAWLIEQLQERGCSLPTAQEMARINAQWQANAFKNANTAIASRNISQPAESPLRWSYSLFANVARINHSCGPNARASYIPASGSEAIYSVCDIAAGEEILIAYFDLSMHGRGRKQRAQDWGFVCHCRACEMSSADYKIYAHLLVDIRKETKFADLLAQEEFVKGRVQSKDGGKQAVQRVQKLIDLVRSEKFPWLVLLLPELYKTLSDQYLSAGMAKEAKDAARTSVELEEGMAGSSEFLREFAMAIESS